VEGSNWDEKRPRKYLDRSPTEYQDRSKKYVARYQERSKPLGAKRSLHIHWRLHGMKEIDDAEMAIRPLRIQSVQAASSGV
jgi:hypothetical protein